MATYVPGQHQSGLCANHFLVSRFLLLWPSPNIIYSHRYTLRTIRYLYRNLTQKGPARLPVFPFWRAILALGWALFSGVSLYFANSKSGAHFAASEAHEPITPNGRMTRNGEEIWRPNTSPTLVCYIAREFAAVYKEHQWGAIWWWR